jgi:hypothetical protein
VGVGDDQLQAAQSTGLQAPQERRPERAVLTVPDVDAQHLTPSVGGHPDRHDNGLRHDPVVHAGLAVGRVEEHVRVRRLGQRPVAERGDLLVEVLADPAHLGLGDPGVRAQGLDQVVDLARAHAMQIRLHDRREQCLIDPPTPLQQAREERPRPQLRDPQLQIPGRRREQPGTGPVADRGAGLRSFPESRADHALSLRIDQRLIHALRGDSHALIHAGGLQRLQQIQQGRLLHSHRARCPLVSS